MKKMLALLLGLTLAVTACGSSSPETKTDPKTETQTQNETKTESPAPTGQGGEELRIGLLAPLSGPIAEYGIASSNGTKLAFEILNSKNYLEGQTISSIAYDTEADQTKAVNLFNKLVSNDKIAALVGPVISSTSLAVAPVAQEENIPMITPTGTHLDITPDYPNVFRACFIDPYQGMLAGQFAVENLGVKKVAIVYNVGSDYSVGLAEEFKKVVEAANLTIVSNEGYSEDDKDFSALAAKIKAGEPELVFVPDYYNKVGILVGQLKTAGVEATFLGGDGWDGVLANYAKEAEGCYYLTHFSTADTSEAAVEFVSAYREKYHAEPSSFAALGYDAGQVIVEAVKKAGSTEPEAMVKALNEMEFQGITGLLQFDENGNPKNKDVTVIKVVDGKAVVETKIKGK